MGLIPFLSPISIVQQQWFNGSPTDVPCLTTPLPTEERLSRPQAESWSTNTLPKPQNAVTLVSPSVVSRPAVHVNWLSTQRDRRPSAVLMVVPSHLAPSVPASSAPF